MRNMNVNIPMSKVWDDQDSPTVLRAVRERDMDVYTLMAQTGLALPNVESALKELVNKELIVVRGSASGDQLREAYVTVPVRVKGYVDTFLGRY